MTENNGAENKNGDGLVLAKEKTIDVKKRKRNNILGLILTLVIFGCVIYAGFWRTATCPRSATSLRE